MTTGVLHPSFVLDCNEHVLPKGNTLSFFRRESLLSSLAAQDAVPEVRGRLAPVGHWSTKQLLVAAD